MFHLVGIFRTSSPRDSISSYPGTTVLRRQGKEPDYTEVLQQRTGSLNIKRLLLIKESWISQVKEFSAFLFWGRCKSLGSLKSFIYIFFLYFWLCWNHHSFDLHFSYLGPIFCFHALSSSGLTVESGCSLMAARWQVSSTFLSFLRAQWLGRLPTIADDCDTLVYWYDMKYSISQASGSWTPSLRYP